MCETVAIYCRVSTAGQDPENQRAILDAIARERGLTVYGVYEDVASGKDAHRPELDRMMADARRHRFDTILTLRVDRLGRSTINLYNLLDELAHLRITVEFVAQGIRTGGSTSGLVLGIFAAIAQWEREIISDRTKEGLARAASEGRRGGRPRATLSPYQIRRIAELIEADPEATAAGLARSMYGISAPTMRRLLREYAPEIDAAREAVRSGSSPDADALGAPSGSEVPADW